MEIKRRKMIGQGNTAEIYRLDDNKILKLFRSGLNKGIIEREYQNGIIVQKMLDWMTACRGDVCADVARTCMMLKYGEVAHAPWIMRKLISIFQHHIYKIYIKEYLIISKRNIEDINRWELPVAAARLREWIPENEKQVLMQLVNEHCDKLAPKVI